MLPPPITTPAMDDDTNHTQSLATQQQKPYQSGFFLNSAPTKDISSSSSSISTNSFPTVPFNTTSIKNFFNKTLANVAKTNLSNYTAQYTTAFTKNSTLANTSSTFSSSNSHAIAAEVYGGLIGEKTPGGVSASGGVAEQTNGFDTYAAAADMAVSSLSNGSHHLETTTAFPTAQTVATFIAGNKNRATTIIVYPTGMLLINLN